MLDGPDPALTLAWIGAFVGPVAALLVWRLAGAPTRRRWPMRLALLGFASLYGVCVYTFLIEPRTLAVRHVVVTSAAWSGPALRIGVLSDTHVGAHVTPARVRSVVERLNRERPDIIVYLGDYVGGHQPMARRSAKERAAIKLGVAALGQGRAPLGVVAVLGNHDWWYGGPAVEAAIARSGIRVLQNEAVLIGRPGAAFWIGGLSDPESPTGPRVARTLAMVPPEEPVILLTHWPDPFAGVPPRVALTLAGHSHCGQVNLPVLGRLVHASAGSKRWPCGLYDEGGRKLLVSGGLGVSILPVRFRAPPELLIVTLRGSSRL